MKEERGHHLTRWRRTLALRLGHRNEGNHEISEFESCYRFWVYSGKSEWINWKMEIQLFIRLRRNGLYFVINDDVANDAIDDSR